MRKLTLGTKLIGLLATAAAVAACGSDDDGGTVVGGSGGNTVATGSGGSTTGPATGGSTGTATGGSTGTTNSACTGAGTQMPTGDGLIDDFEEADPTMPSSAIPENEGRVGTWYTENDGTLGGMQTPASSKAVPVAGAGYMGSWGFESEASGLSDYGGSFGVTLNNSTGTSCTYNASSYEGIEFWIKSKDGTAQTIEVKAVIPAVVPVAEGGTCAADCYNTHVTTVDVTADWQKKTIAWADFKQPAWGPVRAFDPASIAQISWGVKGADGTPGAGPGAYSLVVDDVAFYGGSFGGGGAAPTP